MKGHLRERSPGHWAIVIDVRDPVSGQRKQHSFRDTKREPQIKKAELIAPLFCSCIAQSGGRWPISCESRPPARFRRALSRSINTSARTFQPIHTAPSPAKPLSSCAGPAGGLLKLIQGLGLIEVGTSASHHSVEHPRYEPASAAALPTFGSSDWSPERAGGFEVHSEED